MRITALGDTALRIEFGDQIDESTHRRVQAAFLALEAGAIPGVSEFTPAYTTVTLFYDPAALVAAGAPTSNIFDWLETKVRETLDRSSRSAKIKGRSIEIPVAYGGDFGPDLAEVAAHAKMSPQEVIRRHSKTEYSVYLVGFAPGFGYLGGLPKELSVPRRSNPRLNVPAGSLGIGGSQTGIYPINSPGGWNLIGRTPKRMFRVEDDPPTLLRMGDRVKFRAITLAEFEKWEEGK